MHSFCTIITANYFFYAKTIYDSLAKFYDDLKFEVLIVDDVSAIESYKNIEIIKLSDIKDKYPDDYKLISKYEIDKASNLRWALKPLLLKYLLKHKQQEKVLFVDPDVYFYNDPSFLFDELSKKDVVITPHWRSKDPFKDQANFDWLFLGGIYNAGFFGCNQRSIPILDWWLKACSYKMSKENGFYVDQVYLNLMPVYFEDQVKIITHKGCNVANWNTVECVREVIDTKVLINGKDPVIFIHFTKGTMTTILNGKDGQLLNHLNTYSDNLKLHNSGFQIEYNEKSKPTNKKRNYIKRILKKIVS